MKLQLRQGEMMSQQDKKKKGGRERKARNPKEKLVNIQWPLPFLAFRQTFI